MTKSTSKSLSSSSNDKLEYKACLRRIKRLEQIIAILCVIGTFVSLYSLYVEISKSNDSGYVAFCDIGPFSCTRIFGSRYGKGFGLLPEDSILNQPNSIYGMIFYSVMLLLLLFRNQRKMFQLKLFLSVLSNLGTIYLASILYFVLYDFCIVCFSIYVVNAFLLYFNYKHSIEYDAMVGFTRRKGE